MAGRRSGRGEERLFVTTAPAAAWDARPADRALDQKTVDDEFVANDILTNCRQYPKDERPAGPTRISTPVLDS